MSKTTGKNKKKRDLEKYPALNPRLNAKTRYDVLDMDYLKKLSAEELDFLNQFMAEYVSGAFKKDENGEYSDSNFHKTVEERRECYTRNNTRNRCGLTVSNATGKTFRSDDISSFMDSLSDDEILSENNNSFSDYLIDEFNGELSEFEDSLTNEMYQDYLRCVNPKNTSDKNLALSNYGLMLIEKFKKV